MCCFQNPKKLTRYCASFLVVGYIRCTHLYFFSLLCKEYPSMSLTAESWRFYWYDGALNLYVVIFCPLGYMCLTKTFKILATSYSTCLIYIISSIQWIKWYSQGYWLVHISYDCNIVYIALGQNCQCILLSIPCGPRWTISVHLSWLG